MILLPNAFLDYWSRDEPKEGPLLVEPGWFQLWEPGEVAQLNEDYGVAEFASGFLGFGSSGGGEMLVFDPSLRVFMLPFIGMNPEEAILIAESWDDFLSKIER